MEPPRRRGKDSGTVHGCGQLRITPAWAGKSRPSPASEMPTKDHPRVGREKFLWRLRRESILGSPPRGRGKLQLGKLCVDVGGITPAWAGKSGSSAAVRSGAWDHPRVGGEKGARRGPALGRTGSPPRGRGKEGLADRQAGVEGITPAPAGKSRFPGIAPALVWDHPRMGGEKASSSPIRDFLMGSPPRGRGKGGPHDFFPLGPGITPA